jgi:hypothetical protein
MSAVMARLAGMAVRAWCATERRVGARADAVYVTLPDEPSSRSTAVICGFVTQQLRPPWAIRRARESEWLRDILLRGARRDGQ